MIQALKFTLPKLANLLEPHFLEKRSFFSKRHDIDLSKKRNRGIYYVEGDREAEINRK